MGKLKNNKYSNLNWRDEDAMDDYLDDDYQFKQWKKKQKRRKQEDYSDDSNEY